MKKAKLLALFGSICLTLALVVTLSGGLALADKPQDELPPGIEKKVEPVEAEISFIDGAPIPPNVRPVIVLSGSDYDMGYQLHQQLVQIYGPWILDKAKRDEFTAEEITTLKASQWYIKEYASEFIDFMKGMADGATDAGVELSYTEVLARYTGTRSYPGTEPPGSEKEKLPPKDECSGFAIWGDATKDGRLICAGSGDHDLIKGWRCEIVLIFFPETGNNFISAPKGTTNIAAHPAMNNKGLVFVHHGAGTSGNEEPGYGIPGTFSTLHTLRFADDANEALAMQLAYPGRKAGLWADIHGNAFDLECRDPEVVRRAGDYDETNFIYATNNIQALELEEFVTPHPILPTIYIPHAGWLGTGASISSIGRNLVMWNMLHNYQGEVDLEFAKMMWRFPAEQPDYPTLEEANAAYYPTQGEGWDQHICDLENSGVGICLPDDGDEGLYYMSQGCAARITAPLVPTGHYYRVAPTYSFYELKLASSPAEVTEAAKAQAQYEQYYANLELRKLDYSDDEYAPLDEIFNQAAREWINGCWHMDLAKATTGDESIYNWSKSLRAFTACQALARQVYNSLVPPATCPSGLGLQPWWGDWEGAEWATR